MCAGATTTASPIASEKNPVQGCKPGNPACQRTRRDGSSYCLAHEPEAKDYKQFMAALLEELKDPAKDSLNAEGWVFPSDENGFVKLDLKELSKPIILKNAEFRGEVYFNIHFLKNADFSGSHFKETANFAGAEFKDDESGLIPRTSFAGATFEQEVNFEKTIFFENVSFAGCRFKAELKMDESTQFESEALFNQTQFEGEATMSGAKFKGTADFTGASFKEPAKFVSTEFTNQAVFERTNFAKLVDFNDARFSSSAATFVDAVFQQRVVFDETKFLDGLNVSFDKAKFNGSVSFKKSQFERVSYFIETEFAQKVEFSEKTTFTQPAHFKKTNFNEISFTDVEFKADAEFESTRFNGWAEFSQTKFAGKTIFDRTQFLHLTVFNKVNFGQDVAFNVHVNERNRLAIRGSDLSTVKFSGSNIDNIDFQDCTWIKTKFYRWKIKDEPESGRRTPERIKKLIEARRLYRQLRLNYDKAGEYEVAGRFYVSESEMSYLLRAPFYRWIHPRGLYKWASRYGQSIVQAAGVMFGLILLFTLFYYWFSSTRQIWFRDPPKPLGTQNLVTLSWWESVWLSVQACKPLADVGLSPKTIVYWVVLAEGLIVPTQIGLFLLAIRRRFRRGD